MSLAVVWRTVRETNYQLKMAATFRVIDLMWLIATSSKIVLLVVLQTISNGVHQFFKVSLKTIEILAWKNILSGPSWPLWLTCVKLKSSQRRIWCKNNKMTYQQECKSYVCSYCSPNMAVCWQSLPHMFHFYPFNIPLRVSITTWSAEKCEMHVTISLVWWKM